MERICKIIKRLFLESDITILKGRIIDITTEMNKLQLKREKLYAQLDKKIGLFKHLFGGEDEGKAD